MLAESILRNIRSVFSLLLSFFNILFIFWGKILNIFLYQPSFFSKALQKSVLNRVIGFISDCNRFCNIFFNNYFFGFFAEFCPSQDASDHVFEFTRWNGNQLQRRWFAEVTQNNTCVQVSSDSPAFFWAFCSHFYLLLERGKSEGKCIRILQSAHVKTAKFERSREYWACAVATHVLSVSQLFM